MLVTGEAQGFNANNYQAKRAHYEKVQDHAGDVFRFFRNHPKPARSTIGKHVLRKQHKLDRKAERKLNEIREFVYSGRFLPSHWFHIATCESGGNPPIWTHNSGTYQGAFGFHHDSWDRFNYYGYPSEAYLATPEQQYRVALAIYDMYGFSGWGCA